MGWNRRCQQWGWWMSVCCAWWWGLEDPWVRYGILLYGVDQMSWGATARGCVCLWMSGGTWMVWLGLHWSKVLEWVCPGVCTRERRRRVQACCEVCLATATLLDDGLLALSVGRVWGAWYLVLTMDHELWKGASEKKLNFQTEMSQPRSVPMPVPMPHATMVRRGPPRVHRQPRSAPPRSVLRPPQSAPWSVPRPPRHPPPPWLRRKRPPTLLLNNGAEVASAWSSPRARAPLGTYVEAPDPKDETVTKRIKHFTD